jgi:HEAT repeat protein
MRTRANLGGVLLCCALLPAQEVWLEGGEVLPGAVVDVKDNRARIRGADGALRQLSVRRIDHEVAADGTVRRFTAAVHEGALGAAERALLEQVQKGQEAPFPELMQATEHSSRAFVEALQAALAGDKAAVREQAARVLVATAVPEAVHAALAAAVEEPKGRMLQVIAPSLSSGCMLAALEASDALALVDAGLGAKDPDTRFFLAWVGARLGSEAALPVLARSLTDRDHHVRESAAVALAERGDAAGAALLMTMARRSRSPVQNANRTADAETRALVDRLALRERCRACELLGRLRHEPALAMLRKLATDKDPQLAAAAGAAVAAITADH